MKFRTRKLELVLARSTAFSLIEIMVTVALLSFIIIGLMAMFNQTRRAFVSSMTQVDILESGRITTDMVARDVEQLASTLPSGSLHAVNFEVVPNPNYPPGLMVQELVAPGDLKTNNIEQFYFVTRNNQQWNAIGYRLSASDYANGIGTLYRFSTNNISYQDTTALLNLPYQFFHIDPVTGGSGYWSRVIDGVVDFRVNVYNMKGSPMTNFNSVNYTALPILITNNPVNGEYMWDMFTDDALPAYVEIELGVLEDRSLARYQALSVGGTGPGTAAWGYLTNHAGQVHIFRQRVPIRNVNPAYYP